MTTTNIINNPTSISHLDPSLTGSARNAELVRLQGTDPLLNRVTFPSDPTSHNADLVRMHGTRSPIIGRTTGTPRVYTIPSSRVQPSAPVRGDALPSISETIPSREPVRFPLPARNLSPVLTPELPSSTRESRVESPTSPRRENIPTPTASEKEEIPQEPRVESPTSPNREDIPIPIAPEKEEIPRESRVETPVPSRTDNLPLPSAPVAPEAPRDSREESPPAASHPENNPEPSVPASTEKENAAPKPVEQEPQLSPEDLLKKNIMMLSKLPSPKFESAIQRAFAALKSDLQTYQQRKQAVVDAVMRLQPARWLFHKASNALVFTPNGPGMMPSAELRESSNLNGCHFTQGIYLTQPVPMGSYSPSLGALHGIVQYLRTRTDIFPWEYSSDGCYARADLMVHYLRLMGIPLNNIGKIILAVPSSQFGWVYHIAPIVTLEDGTEWVIDPSLETTQALDRKAWMSLQADSSLPVNDLGRLQPGTTNYDSRYCSVCTIAGDCILSGINREAGQIDIMKTDESVTPSNLDTLATYRSVVDNNHLNSLVAS